MRKFSQKVIASGMSLVLAVGLTPVPAFAATGDLATGSSALTTQAAAKSSLSDCSVSFKGTSTHVYNGQAFTPEPSVTYYGRTLTKGVDYTVAYKGDVAVSWDEVFKAFPESFWNDYASYSYDEDGNIVYDYSNINIYGTSFTAEDGTVYSHEWNDEEDGYTWVKRTNVVPISVGTYTAVITGIGSWEGTRDLEFSIVQDLTWDNVTTSFLGVKNTFAFTGGVIKPTVVAKIGEKVLTLNADYTVSYGQYKQVYETEVYTDDEGVSYTVGPYWHTKWVDVANPVEIGDYVAVVKPAGSYARNADGTAMTAEQLDEAAEHCVFSIANAKNFNTADVVWPNGSALLYTGSPVSPKPYVIANGVQLEYGKDYVVRAQTRVAISYEEFVSALGEKYYDTYYHGNYGEYFSANGTGTGYGIDDEFDSYNDTTGVYNPGYFKFQDTTAQAVGEYFAYILGIGDYQSTTTTPNFTRSTFSVYAGKNLSDWSYVDAKFPQGTRYAFTGGVIAPKPVVTYRGETLVEGVDYVLKYDNDKTYLPGSYSVTVNGIGAYYGSCSLTYTIYSKTDFDALDITMPNDWNTNFAYTGEAINVKPSKVELYGRTLKEGRDYTVAYRFADSWGYAYDAWVDEPREVGTYAMYIVGQGVYSAEYTMVPFRIVEKNSLLAATVVMKNQFDYTGKKIKPKPIVVLGGKILKNKKDYKLTYFGNDVTSYDGYKKISKPKNAGSYDVQIAPKSSKYTDVTYAGFEINPIDLNDESVEVSLKKDVVPYTGKAKNPKVVVKLDGDKVKKKNYDVSYAQDAIELGNYAVTVIGKKNYTGSVDLSYQVGPANTKIKKLTGKANSFTVKWKKVSKKKMGKGYEVRYSVNKDMSKAKVKKVKKAKKTKLTVKNLQAGTKYYVQVRAYAKANGEKIYGNWSKTKKVITA